uniref:Uncharacterized protein n=1 Tax=Guillardia theta TaxID=55529 RepID=A0A7S4PIL6_GUITH
MGMLLLVACWEWQSEEDDSKVRLLLDDAQVRKAQLKVLAKRRALAAQGLIRLTAPIQEEDEQRADTDVAKISNPQIAETRSGNYFRHDEADETVDQDRLFNLFIKGPKTRKRTSPDRFHNDQERSLEDKLFSTSESSSKNIKEPHMPQLQDKSDSGQAVHKSVAQLADGGFYAMWKHAGTEHQQSHQSMGEAGENVFDHAQNPGETQLDNSIFSARGMANGSSKHGGSVLEYLDQQDGERLAREKNGNKHAHKTYFGIPISGAAVPV